jgi:S1-C subfamily serine protease
MENPTPPAVHKLPRRRRLGRAKRLVLTGAIAGGLPLLAVPGLASAAGASPALTASGGLDVSAIAAKVDPAIVDINTTLANGRAAGTGMVLTSSGEVLTNNHVINGATDIQVQIAGSGPSYEAKVLGYDAADDVALIQIQGVSGLKTVTTGDVSQVAVGDSVVALGNALGRGGTPAVAQGHVTGLNQSITATDDDGSNPEKLTGLIETDAPIQPGDSGGPLANSNGDVIGMDSAGSSNGTFTEAATDGYAIPIDHALAIAHQIESGTASANVHIGSRAILGVEVGGQSSAPANGSFGSGDFGGFGNFGGFGDFPWSILGGNGNGSDNGSSATPSSGVQVSGVEPGGPADSAGIAAGDTITSVDGQSVASSDNLSAALGSQKPGDQVQVGWVDGNGQAQQATVTLVAGPPA